MDYTKPYSTKTQILFSRSIILIAIKGTNFSASIIVHVPNRHTYRGLATYIEAHSTARSVSPAIHFIDILRACCAKVIFFEIPTQSEKDFYKIIGVHVRYSDCSWNVFDLRW
jgi:hypothetical protein